MGVTIILDHSDGTSFVDKTLLKSLWRTLTVGSPPAFNASDDTPSCPGAFFNFKCLIAFTTSSFSISNVINKAVKKAVKQAKIKALEKKTKLIENNFQISKNLKPNQKNP